MDEPIPNAVLLERFPDDSGGWVLMDTAEYRAEFVRDLRRELDVDQREFAQFAGVTTTMVSRWENARCTVSNETWELLHDFRDAYRRSPDPDRFVELARLAVSLVQDRCPIELVGLNQLEETLRDRLRTLDLSSPPNSAEMHR